MAHETDAHQVEGLALHGLDARVEREEGRHDRVVPRAPAPGPGPGAAGDSDSRFTTTSKRSGVDPLGEPPPGVPEVVHGAEVRARLEALDPR